jgi:hypothetical protein
MVSKKTKIKTKESNKASLIAPHLAQKAADPLQPNPHHIPPPEQIPTLIQQIPSLLLLKALELPQIEIKNP